MKRKLGTLALSLQVSSLCSSGLPAEFHRLTNGAESLFPEEKSLPVERISPYSGINGPIYGPLGPHCRVPTALHDRKDPGHSDSGALYLRKQEIERIARAARAASGCRWSARDVATR